MRLEMNAYMSTGARVFATVPEPSSIPVKAVREAVEKLVDRHSKMREASAMAQTADIALKAARAAIEQGAAVEAENGGKINSKGMVKRVRAAEDELAEARLEFKAREAAVAKAHGQMVEIIEKHAPAWRDAALQKIDAAVLKLTTARRQVEIAAAELAEPLDVLGMLAREDRLPVMTATGMSAFHVSVALESLGGAIGAAMDSRDGFMATPEAARVDVEVPVPGEDVVPDPAGEAFAIVAEADVD